MKSNRRTAAIVLSKGQIWKLAESHLEITHMGKRLTEYKQFRTLDNRRANSQMASIERVQQMLKENRAVLLDPADTKPKDAKAKKPARLLKA